MNSKKTRFIAVIILISTVTILLIIQNKEDKILLKNGQYTIGKVIEKRIAVGAGPTYVYEYKVNNKTLRQKGSSGFNGKENGFYFVVFDSKNPKNSEILINFPVPDSMVAQTKDYIWRKLPLPHTESEVLKGIR